MCTVCNLWLIPQQGQEFQPSGFDFLERQKRGTKLINVAPKFRGLQQRKRSGQIRRKPQRLMKNNGKRNKNRDIRAISKSLVKINSPRFRLFETMPLSKDKEYFYDYSKV